MSTLAALQQDFLSTLTGAPLLIHALDAARGLAPDRGLAIYVNAYSARLREALHNDHASLAMLMGEQAWHALVAQQRGQGRMVVVQRLAQSRRIGVDVDGQSAAGVQRIDESWRVERRRRARAAS